MIHFIGLCWGVNHIVSKFFFCLFLARNLDVKTSFDMPMQSIHLLRWFLIEGDEDSPSPGVIWQCLETFLIATTGGWFYRLLLASRNERPRMLLFRQKTEAHRKESSRKISIVPRLRNPDFFIQQVRTACLLGALSTVNILTKFLPSQRLQFSGIYYKPNSFKLNIYQNKRTNKIQVIKTTILNLKEG